MMRMKNGWKGGVIILCLFALVMGACPSPTGDDSGDYGRTPVRDGTYTAQGPGKSTNKLMTVTTTFANNAIVDISIGENGETEPILNSVKELMIPRIIETQTLGVDVIAGATFSSVGVKTAVARVIDDNGGKSDEWYDPLPKSSKTVTLSGYDVIVVGLGGAGMSAYLKASEQVNGKFPQVFGIEAAGKIGGNSATAGGPMATNSEWVKTNYSIDDYVDESALRQQWAADMEAVVPAAHITIYDMARSSFTPPVSAGGPPSSHDLPTVGAGTPQYLGGPKWEIINKLIDQSGETVDWLAAPPYSFHFNKPSGLSFPQYQVVINYGGENWSNGDYNYDGFNNQYKTTMFTRAVEAAKARNPKSGYKLELRATDIIMAGGRVTGVKAIYRDGTVYNVLGKSVILCTGGYIGNAAMKEELFGSSIRSEAVDTQRGDGITMALKPEVGAGKYNLDMPAVTHIAHLKNIVRTSIFPADPAKDSRYKSTLISMLLKGDNVVVGLKQPKNFDTDLRGKRFAKEGYAQFALDGLDFQNWQVGGFFAAIFSNDEIANIKANGYKFKADTIFWMTQDILSSGIPGAPGPSAIPDINTPIADIDDILARGEQQGNVVKAATLAELASKLEIGNYAAALRDTITQYNGYVDQAEAGDDVTDIYDKSGRLPSPTGIEFGLAADYYKTKVTLDCPSGYTAILGAGYYYGTCGGLDVDENAQVLDNTAAHAPIPGLYACGQDSSGVLYNARKAYVGYGAAAQGWAVTSGRLAGEKAAREATQP